MHAGEGEQDGDVLGVERLVVAAAETVGQAGDLLDREPRALAQRVDQRCRSRAWCPVPIMVSSFLSLSRPTMSKLIIITVEASGIERMLDVVLRAEQPPLLAREGDEDDAAGQGVARGPPAGGPSPCTIAVPDALSSAPLWMSLERNASEPDNSPPRPRWS